MRRDDDTLEIETYANRLPDDLSGRQCFVLDPMLATGHTMVMNAALRRVVLQYSPRLLADARHVVYLVALAVGAKVYYDEVPHVHYRQHSENVLGAYNVEGARESLYARWRRRWDRWRAETQEFFALGRRNS